MTYINDFWGETEGGWGSISSIALYRYSTCSLLALLCRGLEQEHAGGNFGAFISKLLSHYRTDVSWLNWYLVLTVVGSPHFLLLVWLNQEEGREEGITNLVCRPFKVFITCTGTFFGLCEAWEQL